MLRSVVVASYGGNLGGRKGVSCAFPRTAYRTGTSHATQMVETGLGGAANEAHFRAKRDLADNLYRSSANHLCPTTKACPARVLRRRAAITHKDERQDSPGKALRHRRRKEPHGSVRRYSAMWRSAPFTMFNCPCSILPPPRRLTLAGCTFARRVR